MTKDLVEIFNLDQSLHINKDDPLILDRITKKLDLVIESRKFEHLFIKQSKQQQKFDTNPLKKNTPFDWKEGLRGTLLISALSLSSYIYFKRYSDFIYRANSVKLYPRIFLFTFCFVPIGLNIYLTKLNFDIMKLQ